MRVKLLRCLHKFFFTCKKIVERILCTHSQSVWRVCLFSEFLCCGFQDWLRSLLPTVPQNRLDWESLRQIWQRFKKWWSWFAVHWQQNSSWFVHSSGGYSGTAHVRAVKNRERSIWEFSDFKSYICTWEPYVCRDPSKSKNWSIPPSPKAKKSFYGP